MNPDLALALELADAADAISLARFRAADLIVETKPDMTPVSEADRAVEAEVRRRIELARPGDDVLGEEFGASAGASGGEARRWIIDPIDGTKNYTRGVPIWATLIALEAGGEIVAGVASAPALGGRWWAARGEGAFANGRPIRVSQVSRLDDAYLTYDSVRGFEKRGMDGPFLALAKRVWSARAFGDFWSHVLVAEGAVDAAVEPSVTLWDLAALLVIVEEAGGRFTDLSGKRTADGGSAVSTNGILHDEVLAALTG